MMWLHPKNYLDVGIMIGLTVGAWFINLPLAALLAHFTGLVYWYLRDTKRYFAKNSQNCLSPIDGVVLEIIESTSCPHGTGDWRKISIDTGLFDSHTQYASLDGTLASHEIMLERITITLSDIVGDWILRFLENDPALPIPFIVGTTLVTHIHNAKNNAECIIETITSHGYLNLVPGLKRIIHSGFIDQGSRVGLGHFGYHSTITNVYIPTNASVEVDIGQVVLGSETVVAQFSLEQRTNQRNDIEPRAEIGSRSQLAPN